jgi:hypothetical protein
VTSRGSPARFWIIDPLADQFVAYRQLRRCRTPELATVSDHDLLFSSRDRGRDALIQTKRRFQTVRYLPSFDYPHYFREQHVEPLPAIHLLCGGQRLTAADRRVQLRVADLP